MSDTSVVENQILKGSEAGGKFYEFNECHDRTQPAQMWFQESPEGKVLFVVFYSQACRWSRCLGCNLPSKSSQFHVGYKDLIAQIDHVFALDEVSSQSLDIKKLILSNNGSMFDEDTFSSTALMYLMAKLNLTFPNLATVTMETRPEYVDIEELEFISRALKEGDTPTDLELAIGFEAFDEEIRNDHFQKGLDLAVFEKFIQKVAPFDYKVKCYFMQKPIPNMSDAKAVDDITNAIDYLGTVSEKYGVDINMHLNPTYAAYGTALEESFNKGEFVPPQLSDVAQAVLSSEGKPVSIFVGLFDEGLAVEGGSFIREGDQPLIDALDEFNKTQDHSAIKQVLN